MKEYWRKFWKALIYLDEFFVEFVIVMWHNIHYKKGF